MATMVERLIERMIGDGIITEAELEARINEARKDSPFANLVDMQDDTSFLFYDSMLKDGKIVELESQNAELYYMIMMGGN